MDYNFLKPQDNFFQGKPFHNQQEAENAFQGFAESISMDFYTTRINLLLVGKNVIMMVHILINKDMFEPSYNYLKFKVQNWNYVFSNPTVLQGRSHILDMFSSVTQLYPTLGNPMDCSTPGFPVRHQLLEPTQTHVH